MRRFPSFLTLATATLLMLAVGTPLSAQTVRGTLVQKVTGAPIPGAVVVLLDSAGIERARTLTNAGGHFRLDASAPGRYRLRADRIGYTSTRTPLFTLARAEVLTRRIEAAVQAITLAGITATAESRCHARPESGSQTARVWREAKKALSATVLTRETRPLRFALVIYKRMLMPETLEVLWQKRRSRLVFNYYPFGARTAEDLAARGYVRTLPDSTVYYGVDGSVLLSETFRETHCFHVTREDAPAEGLIGLAFEPVPGRMVADIAGTLWLDENTAELRTLEYHYTRLPWPGLENDRFGGWAEFARLPGGAWIVRRWWIRMPQMRILVKNGGALVRGVVREPTLGAIREKGGVVA